MKSITKMFRKITPKERAAEHLYQAEMELLESSRALEHYQAQVNALKITIARLSPSRNESRVEVVGGPMRNPRSSIASV